MHDHMFNPNSPCEEVCAGNGVDLADAENGGEFHEDSARMRMQKTVVNSMKIRLRPL
jgi:hypothetical protein